MPACRSRPRRADSTATRWPAPPDRSPDPVGGTAPSPVPPRGLFVTGTDTGAGKSVLAAAISAGLVARGLRVAAAKPVLTGTDDEPGAWPADHDLLAGVTGQAPEEVAPVRFGPAVSPHLAAAQAGIELDAGELAAQALATGAGADALVVEGVGGLLVPLSARESVRDFAQALGLPLVVAARPGLGTISHTLLTLEAARAAGLDVRAVVLTPWPEEPSAIERSNAETLAAHGRVFTLPATSPDALVEAARELPVEDWLGPPATPRPSLDHVVIAVSDWERSNAFYRDVCLAELVELSTHGPRRWRYRFGDVQLNVHGPGMDPQPAARLPVAPGNADLCLVWPGTAATALAHLRDHGVEAELGPEPRNGARGVGQSVYFRDPDGALLEFMSYNQRP